MADSPASVLIGLGFWYSFYEPELPAPSAFIDQQWDAAERQGVVDYLRQGQELRCWMGYSWCRFHCGIPDSNIGAADMTDGTYCWPAGLTHYVEHHHVRLPACFVAHALAQTDFPAAKAALVSETTEVDLTWWSAQPGTQAALGCSPFWFTTQGEALDLLRRIDRSQIQFGPEPESRAQARIRIVQALRSQMQ
ncbi:hypothetical protein [Hymenobacter jeollabukensis]|uniref:hypothetical protein n=1 Tax=Hymenobacter jeollabukensis TaxID=2025313 RepID=UPI001BB231EB|nr:hypothetical protein [Hymenobacter jeollabukensis]